MYLVDSDILIDHLRQAIPINESLKYLWNDSSNLYISAVTELEIFSGQSTKNSQAIKIVFDLLSVFSKISATSEICQKAGELRRDFKLAPLDAIIAATALDQDLMLITHNQKHYQKVPKLKLFKKI